jgi:hypothetical protein
VFPDASVLEGEIAEVKRLAEELGHGPMTEPRIFEQQIQPGVTYHGVVIGLPIRPLE